MSTLTLLPIIFLAVLAVLGSGVWLTKRWLIDSRPTPRPEFPSLDSVDVLFREKLASGSAKDGVAAHLMTVNNALTVTVTEDELWVASYFPMSLLVAMVDMEHRVPLAEVSSVESEGRKSVAVAFTGPDDQPRRVRLDLRDRDGFLTAIGPRIGSVVSPELSG
ncbi:MAG: hypothetical protein AAGA92_14570 [Planctomycetota bacterium]